MGFRDTLDRQKPMNVRCPKIHPELLEGPIGLTKNTKNKHNFKLQGSGALQKMGSGSFVFPA